MKKKILIVTERRADYSKFRSILQEIKKSTLLDNYLIVTGSHLLKEYGYTINEIRKDGFRIATTFPMYEKDKDDTGAEMVRALGNAIINLSHLVQKFDPDIILSGFDIAANLAVSIVGSHMNIVVAHVEGGEVTGTIDESIRHATSKFAHIHFTSNDIATKRLIKMGEDSKYIFTVGNTALDSVSLVKHMPTKRLESEFRLDFKKPFVIVLQHTVTSEVDKVGSHIMETLQAIKELDVQALIIYGNADAGSQKISQIIKNSRVKQYISLSYVKYINLLKHASALVGNSSSGIIETPFLHIPSINIGTRQNGRPRSISVIDVGYNKNQIKKAILKAINDKNFHNKIKKQKSLYGNGNASQKIVKILENIDLTKIPIQKKLRY